MSCSFCACSETTQHLFFDGDLAKFIWRLVQVSFNLSLPTSMHHLFNDWLGGVNRQLKRQILAGAIAIFWAIGILSHLFFQRKPSA
jgi:hypothetical protein